MSGEHLAGLVVLTPGYDFEADVRATAENGYVFAHEAVTPAAYHLLAREASGLALQASSSQPINPGTAHEVVQVHDRAYVGIDDGRVPMARLVTTALAARIQSLQTTLPELADWWPTEVGYQQYSEGEGHISPHRDRESDQLLAVTITVTGSAPVRAYEPLGQPDDYSQLRLTEEFQTEPGSVMLLKSTGLRDGERTIHEALPPTVGSRLVLNLRMRPDVLIEG